MSKKKLLICIAFIFVLTLIISANAYAAEDPDYLCFTALENETIIAMEKCYGWEDDDINTPTVYLEYSINGEDWKQLKIQESGEDIDFTKVKLSADDKVYFRAGDDGTNGPFADGTTDMPVGNYNSFKTYNGKVNLSGNIMSLLDAKNFESITKLPDFAFTDLFNGCSIVSIENLRLPATELGEYCYAEMFINCESLNDVPKKLLQAKTLKEGCYQGMFSQCIALKTAPELPAKKLAKLCYNAMFAGAGLETAPELPATTLAEGCYNGMFSSTNLTSVPELPAKRLAKGCYDSMFSCCLKLVVVPENLLPATTLAEGCYSAMFYYCTSLEKAPKLPAKHMMEKCYNGMFEWCKALETAPELPARELASDCYHSMFYNCSLLEEAPVLPASKLCERCYYTMFNNCETLSEITVYFTDWGSADTEDYYPTESWLDGVAENGTFYCLPDLETKEIERLGMTIPEGWTIVNTLEPLPPEIDFPWWVIPFIFGGTGSGSSSSSEPSTPVTPVVPTASYDKCTKASDCPMYVYYDLDTTKWYHDGIHFCLDAGLMNGVGSYTFDPDGTTTRPMMVTILSRMDGCDTEGGASWDEVGKAWAKTYGISDGIPEEGNITREEFATMLYRYAQKEGKGFVGDWMFLLQFKDADKVSSWASEAVHWCVMKGILQGRTGLYEGMLDPQATLTRAEASAMIQRFCEVK